MWIRHFLHRFPLFDASFQDAPLFQLPFNTQRWLTYSPSMFDAKVMEKRRLRIPNYDVAWRWLMEVRAETILQPMVDHEDFIWAQRQCIPLEILGQVHCLKARCAIEVWNDHHAAFLDAVESAWKNWLKKNEQ